MDRRASCLWEAVLPSQETGEEERQAASVMGSPVSPLLPLILSRGGMRELELF